MKREGTNSTAPIQPDHEADKPGQANEPNIESLVSGSDAEGQFSQPVNEDVFGNEEGAEIQYKTCDWW